ncbi:hypothetical protein P879_06600 [Paragonimus westermani]|uniref:Uncharacterized protein n=1 Tax=Paragonimus westermani TaxID=34504 RepID=A0A8T0D4K8_9TREM|nr:hypothetical protein P879_06600 [Paragonimus westermani]
MYPPPPSDTVYDSNLAPALRSRRIGFSILILCDLNHPDTDFIALNVHSRPDLSAASFQQTATDLGIYFFQYHLWIFSHQVVSCSKTFKEGITNLRVLWQANFSPGVLRSIGVISLFSLCPDYSYSAR